MNWIMMILYTIGAYALISWYSIRAGEHHTIWQAFFSPVRNWVDFVLVISGSMVYALAIFHGIRSTAFAPSIVITLGVLVSFAFSVWFADGVITPQRLLGIFVVMCGVWLMR
ncbi:MAG: hypothetical protein AAF614_04930 [Chloroflexota bacterium]